MPGWAWEVLLGHVTFCFRFSGHPWSAGARTEITHAIALLPLTSAQWCRNWSEVVCATDTSECGYGTSQARWPILTVRAHGSASERSRLKLCVGRGAREALFEATHIVLDVGVKPRPQSSEELDGSSWAAKADFSENELSLLRLYMWTPMVEHARALSRTHSVLEARALLKMVVCE